MPMPCRATPFVFELGNLNAKLSALPLPVCDRPGLQREAKQLHAWRKHIPRHPQEPKSKALRWFIRLYKLKPGARLDRLPALSA